MAVSDDWVLGTVFSGFLATGVLGCSKWSFDPSLSVILLLSG